LLISTNFKNLPYNVSHHIFLSRITARRCYYKWFYYKWHDVEITNIKEHKLKNRKPNANNKNWRQVCIYILSHESEFHNLFIWIRKLVTKIWIYYSRGKHLYLLILHKLITIKWILPYTIMQKLEEKGRRDNITC